MDDQSAAQQIDNIIEKYGGWKAEILSQLRSIITDVNPEIVEEVKWKMKTRPEGLPVWSHHGIICIAETFKNDIKLVFFKGALMKDSRGLFNARLNSRTDRAIEFREGSIIDETGIKELVDEGIKLNILKSKKS